MIEIKAEYKVNHLAPTDPAAYKLAVQRFYGAMRKLGVKPKIGYMFQEGERTPVMVLNGAPGWEMFEDRQTAETQSKTK